MFVFLPFRADDDEYSFERKPWLTWSILALCIAIYTAMTYGLSEQQIEHLYYEFGCVPSEFHWWTMFTCTLLHGHLLGNMFFFFIYAPMCEKAFGHGRFLLLYLLGAAASMGGHLLMTPAFYRDIPCVGASGAISAVLGAFLVTFPTVRIKSVFIVLIFFPRPVIFSLPAWIVLGCWFLMQIFYSLNLFGGAIEVAFWAHVAGFAAGALIGSCYLWSDRWKQKLDIADRLRRLNSGIAVDPEDLRWLNANGYIDSALLEALTTTDDELAFVRLNTQTRSSASEDGSETTARSSSATTGSCAAFNPKRSMETSMRRRCVRRLLFTRRASPVTPDFRRSSAMTKPHRSRGLPWKRSRKFVN